MVVRARAAGRSSGSSGSIVIGVVVVVVVVVVVDEIFCNLSKVSVVGFCYS